MTTRQAALDHLSGLPSSSPSWYRTSDIVRIVEVAKKYLPEDGTPPIAIPEYTIPEQDGKYFSTPIEIGWTQGFLPGSIWLLAERERLVPGTLASAGYTLDEVKDLARRWQDSFKHLARPALNHDQGFRFQPCYGRDLELTDNKEAIQVLIDAADSLVDRYNPKVGCIRSWDAAARLGYDDEGLYREDNRHEHFIVIIDNMMNLDLMYLATDITGDPKYAEIATTQATRMMTAHVRPDFTTFHVVNFDNGGKLKKGFTAQGYADDSCWSRGQAWAIYGYAQVALRTGDRKFVSTSRKLADVFISLLPESGVPWWDFRAPKPCPYDASAATVAARGMQMLFILLRDAEPEEAIRFLTAANKLVDDTLRECDTPPASLDQHGAVQWGEDNWEPILKHSTINGNPTSRDRQLDQGLVYADYYLLEFENEALKINEYLSGGSASVGVYKYTKESVKNGSVNGTNGYH